MTLNMKMVWGERGYGSGNRTSDVPIWSHMTLGFAKNKWNKFDVPQSPSQSFQISLRDLK